MKSTQAQSGQATVEAVLLGVVLIASAMFVSKQFKEKQYLSTLVKGPWVYVDNMAQHGVWAKRNGIAYNPYTSRRVSTKSEAEQ